MGFHCHNKRRRRPVIRTERDRKGAGNVSMIELENRHGVTQVVRVCLIPTLRLPQPLSSENRYSEARRREYPVTLAGSSTMTPYSNHAEKTRSLESRFPPSYEQTSRPGALVSDSGFLVDGVRTPAREPVPRLRASRGRSRPKLCSASMGRGERTLGHKGNRIMG